MLSKNTRRHIKQLAAKVIKYKQKKVIEISIGARFGNLLYFFLHCFNERAKGENTYILYTETMEYWIEFFPELKDFVLYPEDFSKLDNLDWFTQYYQEFNVNFTALQLNDFIKVYLLKNSSLSAISTENKTVINIRRGDFYKENGSTPSSFDQVAYIQKVIALYPELFNIPVEIVSDDVDWCVKHLNFYEGLVTFKSENTAFDDFLSICSAKNLIISNSTFSYWGAYICRCLSIDNKVIAPNFGSTIFKDSIAIQLDPSWTIIDVLNN